MVSTVRNLAPIGRSDREGHLLGAARPARLSWRLLAPYRWRLSAGAGLALTGVALELASPWPLKFVVDNALGGRPLPGPFAFLDGLSPIGLTAVAAAVGVALVLAGGAVGYLTTYLFGASAERIAADLRGQVFGRLQVLSLRFHDRHRTGDLVTRLTSDASRVSDILVAWFDTVVPELLTLVAMFAVIVAIDVQLALAALAVIPLLAVYAVLVRPRIKAAQREARDRYGAVASRATESLRHVRAAQAFGRGADEQLRFGTDSASAADAAIGALALSARLTPLADVVIAIGTSVIMVLGVQSVLSGRITLGVLLVVLIYLGDVYGPIRSLVGLTISFASAGASRERLNEILGADEVVPDDPHPKALPSGPMGLKLSSVRFAYRSGEPVLKDVDLTVDPGETLCVIGPTGTGKSTLLALLVRLYDPDAGTIEAGGVDLRKLRLSALRASVAFVPQDAWIFDGTIRENIAFGRPDATSAELQDAARIALADEFIDRFPDGMDTMVGEDGARLSGGQRRRLALARALVRRSEILLLDEPTSGLDAASESVVLEAIRSAARGRTTVIVTHRLNVAGIADRVVILAGGTVTDQGSPSICSEVPVHPPGRDRAGRQQDLGRGQRLDAGAAQERPSGRAAVGRNALGHTQTTADDGNDRQRGGEFRDDPRNGQRVPAPPPPHDEGLDPAPEGHAAVAPHP